MNKVSEISDISLKIVKLNIDIFSHYLYIRLNSSIKSRKLPPKIKLTDTTPLHQKGKRDIKGNYKPGSILSNLSKIFEKCTFTQTFQFLTNYFRNINVVLERALVHSSVF